MTKSTTALFAVGLTAATLAMQPAAAQTPRDTLVMAWSLAIYRTLDPADIG